MIYDVFVFRDLDIVRADRHGLSHEQSILHVGRDDLRSSRMLDGGRGRNGEGRRGNGDGRNLGHHHKEAHQDIRVSAHIKCDTKGHSLRRTILRILGSCEK